MDSNILIAEFMDLSTEVDGIYLLPNGLCEEEMMGLGSMIYINEMLYHKSWSWLMLVVEKIEDIRFTFKGNEDRIPRYSVRVENYLVDIIDNYTSEEILHIEGDDRRDATYKAVVEFIKYYNKQQHES